MKYPRLFNKITINENVVAVISILEYCGPFCETDYELVEILCDVISVSLQKNKYKQFTRGTQHEDLFVDIIEGRLKDSNSMEKRLELIKQRLNKYRYVFVFNVLDSDSNQISRTYLRDTLEKMIDGGKAFIHNGRVVLVASFVKERDVNEAITMDLQLYLEKIQRSMRNKSKL